MDAYTDHEVAAACPHCGERQSYDESTHVWISARRGHHTHCRKCDQRIIWGRWLTPTPKGSTLVHWSKP